MSPPRKVGDYELLEELGRGGMAVVYQARQVGLDRLVALKQLGSFHAEDATVVSRFLSESRITGSLTHPNIVTVHDYFQHEDTPYIAMEFVEGGSLRPQIGKLSLAQIGGVMEGVLAALAFAGGRGIVHRDLKPENVMVTNTGAIKVADFGIAKAINAVTMGQHTATGTTVGTPAYMAPEQAMGKEVSPRTDLYAAGVMVYEMVTGRVPFTSQDTPMAVLLKHVNEAPPPLSEIDPTIDPRLEEWVNQVLAKDPADRPESAQAAWDDFEEILINTVGPRWRRDARLGPAGAGPTTPKPLTPASFDAATGEPAKGSGASDDGFATFVPGGDATEAPAPTEGAAGETVVPSADMAPSAPADAASETDGFKTYVDPSAAPAQPPPPTQPPAAPTAQPPASPPARAETPGLAPTAVETVAPETPPASPPDEPPAEKPSAIEILKKRWWIPAGIGAVIFGAIFIPGLLGGDDSSGSSSTPAEPSGSGAVALPEQLPDVAVAADDLIVLESSGLISRLNRQGTAEAQLTDVAAPTSVAASTDGQRVFVVGAQGLTEVSGVLGGAEKLDVPNASFVTSGANGTILAAGGRGTSGTACVYDPNQNAFDRCAELDFAPSGIGAGANDAFAADSGGDAVSVVPLEGAELAPAASITVPGGPRGRIVANGANAFVAVDGGVAVLDTAKGELVRTISLPGTPSSLAISASPSKVFAALPTANRVALIDAANLDAEPQLVNSGSAPAAVAVQAGNALVFNSGDRTVVALAVATGLPAGSALPVPVEVEKTQSVLTGIAGSTSGRKVTLVFRIGGSGVGPTDVRVTDGKLEDGRAAFVIAQEGIRSGAKGKTVEGIEVSVSPKADQVAVALSAASGDFESIRITTPNGGKAVRVVATKAPEPVAPPPSTPVPSTPAPSNPAPAPTPAQPPPSPPPIEVG